MRAKRLILVALAVLAGAAGAQAATRYVNDVIKITMRTGPGINHKVIKMPQSGQQVQLLDTDGDWSYVRMPDGTDGWVLSRFLTDKVPKEIQLSRLREEQENLTRRLSELEAENERLRTENQTLVEQTSAAETQAREATESFAALREESEDYLAVKTAYEETAAELAAHKERADSLAARVDRVEWRSNVIWFMAGGGVFLTGFVIGGFNEKGKRKRTAYF
ncbi:MAG: TIGR04211 family SH3 domain-containing protein [Desulfococcaceae bacterium]